MPERVQGLSGGNSFESKNIMNEPFTEDELAYIASYSLCEMCDLCAIPDYWPIFQEDRENFIIFDGQFICKCCRDKFKL